MELRTNVHGGQVKVPDLEFNYGDVYIRFNIQPYSETDEQGQTRTGWVYDEWFMSYNEYQQVQQGMMPSTGYWDAQTHKVFREYQHTRADDLYVYAQRMLRTTGDTKYSDYITALDQWNAQVSALAVTMSLDVPDIPTL